MFKIRNALVGLAIAVSVPAAAQAAQISGQFTQAGAAALFTNGVVQDFEGVAAGQYGVLALANGLTITTDQPAFVDSDYAGQYNNFGRQSLHNCYCNTSFGQVTFSFANAVNGFGFFWGASDNQWTLSAYNRPAILPANSVIE